MSTIALLTGPERAFKCESAYVNNCIVDVDSKGTRVRECGHEQSLRSNACVTSHAAWGIPTRAGAPALMGSVGRQKPKLDCGNPQTTDSVVGRKHSLLRGVLHGVGAAGYCMVWVRRAWCGCGGVLVWVRRGTGVGAAGLRRT
jgi:hypothetical protein